MSSSTVFAGTVQSMSGQSMFSSSHIKHVFAVIPNCSSFESNPMFSHISTNCFHITFSFTWLVVYLPIWEIWTSVGMMKFPIWWEIHKSHVPNHQPLTQFFIGLLPDFHIWSFPKRGYPPLASKSWRSPMTPIFGPYVLVVELNSFPSDPIESPFWLLKSRVKTIQSSHQITILVTCPWPLPEKIQITQIIPQSHFLRRYGWIHRESSAASAAAPLRIPRSAGPQ